MEKQFIEALKRNIAIVSDEVSALLYQEDVFQTRIKSNLKNKTFDQHAVDIIVKNHYAVALMAIRRQVEESDAEISLMGILKKLEKHNKLLTEEWYVNEWLAKSKLLLGLPDPLLKDFIESIPRKEFRQNFGKRGYLDSRVIKQTIKNFEQITLTIKVYVDSKLAHRDKKEPARVTNKDYRLALKRIEKLTSKYILLIEQIGMPNLKPIIQ